MAGNFSLFFTTALVIGGIPRFTLEGSTRLGKEHRGSLASLPAPERPDPKGRKMFRSNRLFLSCFTPVRCHAKLLGNFVLGQHGAQNV